MSVVRAILELQGSLDTAVIRSADPVVAEIADRFLPRTSANAGWYQEIEAFMVPGEAKVQADPAQAMREVVSSSEGQRLSAPQASRLMYSLGATIHLATNRPEGVDLGWDDPTTGLARTTLPQIFELTAPPNTPDSRPTRSDPDEVISVFTEQFTSWQQWDEVAQGLVQLGVLTEDAATVPLCIPSLVKVGGLEAVVVDTEFTSKKVTLNNVRAVIDPRNWDDNYPAFFCQMEYKGLRTDNWRRVLETVGFCSIAEPIGNRLRTMLKFHKHTVDGPDVYEARLDYDLNDPIPDPWGDGRITVDRGYINLRAVSADGVAEPDPDEKGVTVRTRKVARIEGLSPYAMAKLVCGSGYAYAAMEMILGSASDPDAPPHRFPWLDHPEIPSEPGHPADDSDMGQPANSAASTVITMAVKCVQDISAKQLALAERWSAGQLTVSDLAQHSAEVGARIASDPWRIIEAISKSKEAGK